MNIRTPSRTVVQSAVPRSAVAAGEAVYELDHPNAENFGIGHEITAREKVGGNKEGGPSSRTKA